MEHVELQQGHCVYLLLDELDPFEAAALVEHKTPVLEPRPVGDGTAGQGRTLQAHLLEALACAELAFGREGFDNYASGFNRKPVGFLLLKGLQGGHGAFKSTFVELYAYLLPGAHPLGGSVLCRNGNDLQQQAG